LKYPKEGAAIPMVYMSLNRQKARVTDIQAMLGYQRVLEAKRMITSDGYAPNNDASPAGN
jgi:hypothetical protein